MADDSSDTSVKVGVRIRPMLSSEIQEGSSRCLRSEYNSKQILIGNDNAFTFDNVFPEESSQEDVYESCVSPLVNAFFEGFNATVLAYGQTASGKTYTMGSSSNLHLSEEEYGIIPRVVDDIFLNIQKIEASDKNSTYRLRVQYLELYGEEMKDLLDPLGTVRITIRETRENQMYLSGAREEQVTSAKEVFRLLEKGSMSRTTGSTRMNQSSSRSHAIFTIMLEHSIHFQSQMTTSQTELGMDSQASGSTLTDPRHVYSIPSNLNMDGPEIRKCKFHFVDLAGSERAKRTGAQGLRLKEGIDINKGLLVLGNVISALGGEQKRAHVPYRDSKLTRLLQDSLGGNSKTVMLCCVSPADANYNESLNAVRYANRARNIQNKPVVNIDPTSLLISELRNQIQMLASELLTSREQQQGQQHDSSAFSEDELRILASSGMYGTNAIPLCHSPKKNDVLSSTISRPAYLSSSTTRNNYNASIDSGWSDNDMPSTKLQIINLKKELVTLKEKDRANISSIDFYTDKCERLQRQSSQHTEELIQVQIERDFYKINCPTKEPRDLVGASALATANEEEGADKASDNSQIDVIGGYIRQINRLNGIVSSLQLRHSGEEGEFQTDGILETELTSNIAKLFTSTERQLRSDTQMLRRIERCPSDEDVEESAEDTVVEFEGEEVFEVQDKLYQHRTKLMATEVLDISESIHLKEELVHQLHQSQKQFVAMKEFYESKLERLCEEMETKELEKQKVMDDLRDASLSLQHEHHEDEHMRKEREEKLNKLLHKKEMELKALKKRQMELTNLSKVQSRSFDQIKRLETDILQLKKQRVSLSKSLQQEKKVFLGSLNSKAKEIEKLKKELTSAMSKMTKLAVEKEQSNSKINKMLQNEIFRRRRSAEVRRENSFRVTKSSSSALPTPRSTRRMLQSLVQTSHKNGSLSLNEQKTRSWIDASTRMVVDQEEAVADLSLQCEQQLVLLHNKKDLESAKRSLLDQGSDTEALSDIDAAISKVANQLKCRNTEISRKKTELDRSASSYLSKEQIVQHLYKNAGSSSNEMKNVLKILFEIILYGQKEINTKTIKLQEFLEKQRTQQLALDSAADKMNSQSSNYRREIARIEKEYQSKMMGLFNHSGFHELIQSDALKHNIDTRNNCSKDDKDVDDLSMVTRSGGLDEHSSDGFKAVIAVAEERNAALQSQLHREELRVHELETFVDECNIETKLIQEKYDSKCRENSFLEEECRMLRDIVGDLKTDMGVGSGRDTSFPQSSSSPSPQNLDSCTDFDDETESVLGQYSALREEIITTGSVLIAENNAAHNNSIFDRLTNPSYFTGTQKNIFKKDVREVNRAKVQQRKGDTHKKERKKTEGRRSPPKTASSYHHHSGEGPQDDHLEEEEKEEEEEGGGGGEDVDVVTAALHENAWLDTASSGDYSVEDQLRTPPREDHPSSLGAKKTTPPLFPHSNSNSKSPSNLNENVFSRLLNPNKFTGIHRSRHLDSPA